MTKEEFNKFETTSNSFVFYKKILYWTISKDEDEGLFEVVKDEDGVCDLWKSKWVRFENCMIT